MTDPSTTAAASRAAAIERDTLGHHWRDTALHKWNARREILYLALESHLQKNPDMLSAAENPLDYLDVLEARLNDALSKRTEPDADTHPSDLIEWARFMPAAARVLWLAHHEPQDWLHLRADPAAWLAQIEEWSYDAIGDDVEAAVRLASLLRTEHRQFITLPRPEKGGRPRADAGN
jgi:hypothetical protein